ncbi:MAG: histone deacetylase, partial [Candidatus Latescibacteria bacterium]|nr:histone deacetylase [Candidatus Latescibacterota bacterium]
MRVSYCEGYYVSLPEQHPFPMGKFPALRDILLREGLIQEKDIVGPEQAAWDDLRLIHSEDYLDKLAWGGLSRKEERRLGLPWSEALVRRSRLAVG